MEYTFYSQLGEDTFIFKNFINQKREDGIYIELGATDGYKFSNTKFFHDYLSFRGILIEPNSFYKKLIINRPNDFNFNIAIDNDIRDEYFLGDSDVSGLEKYMTDNYKKDWNLNKDKSYKVKCCPLKMITDMLETKYVDIFSIDVEGGELGVLESFDWNIPVYIIIIELDGHNEDKNNKCRKLMTEKGFFLIKRIIINEFWINPNYFRKDLLYDKNLKNINYKHLFLEPHCSAEILKILNE